MATTPVPDEGVKNAAQEASPQSPSFWGRKLVNESPSLPTPRGPQRFPCMMYCDDGRAEIAHNEREHEMAVKDGWKEKPSKIHFELFRHGKPPVAAATPATEAKTETPKVEVKK